MTVKKVISKISAIEKIAIHDKDGAAIYDGFCQDFRATCEDANNYLNREVDTIRACDSFIVIILL